MNKITAIILHYNRQGNINDVITGIHQQSEQADIWVWDNSNNCPADGRASAWIHSSKNFYCQPRFWLAGMAQTEYVFTQDDDFKITNKELFKQLIELSKLRPDYFIGTRGKIFGEWTDKEKPYQQCAGWVGEGECQTVNTGLSFFRTELLRKIPHTPFFCERPVTDKEYQYGDDMWISSWQKCYAYNFMINGVEQISENGHGLSHEVEHMEIRNRLCQRYWL